MVDSRNRRTGEHSAEIIALKTEAAKMQEWIATLEGRLLRLESEVAVVLSHVGVRVGNPSKGPPAMQRVGRSKRPAPLGPPPLPSTAPDPLVRQKSLLPKARGRMSSVDIDISEMAELVDSLPPPPRSPRK